MALPAERSALRGVARELAREAGAELARLRRVRGPGRRTARSIARARARLALAAAFLAPALGEPALARTPVFVNLSEPFGLRDVGGHSTPVFADIDGDGDLDAFVGETEGNTIFFRNSGTQSAPAFGTPETNPFGLPDVGGFSTLAFIDLDGDDDLDAFLGSALGSLDLYRNTGSALSPAFTFGLTFPFNVGFDTDPTFADVDGDGDFDLFVGEAYGNTHFFENTGTAAVPSLAPVVVNPFGLANVGGEASPRFADLDGDGDLDALFGQDGGNVVYFANTGTAVAPAFAAPVTNPFGLGDAGELAAPAFADLDGDSDLDVLVGGFSGRTLLFANTGAAGAPAFFRPIELSALGLYLAPAFVDIDGDGDLDLFVGGFFEGARFVANTGSASAASFAAPQAAFGLQVPGTVQALAFADLDDDGDFDALLGTSDGVTSFFENTGARVPLPSQLP